MTTPDGVFIDAAKEPCVCYVSWGGPNKGEHCGCTRTGARQTPTGPRAYSLSCEPSEVRTDADGEVLATVSAINPDDGCWVHRWREDDEGRLPVEIPLLRNHDATRRLGTAEILSVASGGVLRARLRFDASASSEVSSVVAGVREGIVRGLSLGWTHHKTDPRRGMLRELSIVPVGVEDESLIDASAATRSATPPASPRRLDARDLRSALADAARRAKAPLAKLARQAVEIVAVDGATRTVKVLAPSRPTAESASGRAWDLVRFTKNAVVLWAHDDHELPIGKAEEISLGADGLSMRIRFGSEGYNATCEAVWQGLLAGMIGAASIGYEVNGETSAEIVELSFEPVTTEDYDDANEDDDDAARATTTSTKRFHTTCSECGATTNGHGNCNDCNAKARTRADATEDDVIEQAKRKNEETTANMWKPSAKEVEAKTRFDAGTDVQSGPLRLAADAKRASELRRSVNIDSDEEEDAETRAFNARVDALEREASVRTDARDREAASDPIAKAKAANEQKMRDAWKLPQVA